MQFLFCIASRSLLPIFMQTKQDPREPVLLMACLKIMLHAVLCLSVITFLICVCWHPRRICRALSSCGQIGEISKLASVYFMLLVVQCSCSVLHNDALGFNRDTGCC